MAMDCVSADPCVGEWQPAQVLSLFSPVIVSNHEQAPHIGQLLVEATAKPGFECGLNSAREACLAQDDRQRLI